MMNERQRMQYLEAMGVDSFMPRWVLPVAPVSRQCVLPAVETAEAGQDSSSVSRRSGAEESVGGQPPGLVGNLLETMSRPQPPRSAGESAAPVPAAMDKPEKAAFSLAFWRVHPQVMVVDARQPSRALPTEALLQAIVASLELAPTLPRAEIQNWPLSGGGDQSWNAAREMIQAFLESRLLSQPVRYLVLMGADAVKAVLTDTDDATVSGKVAVDAFACEALVAPSLTRLLLEPQRKAELWHLLSPLRQLRDEQ